MKIQKKRDRSGRVRKKGKYELTSKKCSNEQFIEAAKSSKSIAECGAKLNIKSPYYYDFYKKANELAIDISHFKNKEQIKLQPGMKINRLTILEKAYRNYNKRYWLCLCECGKQKNIMGSHITSGQSQSCGCLAKEVHSKFPIVDSIGDLSSARYSQMRRTARVREIEFNVSIKYLWELYLKQDKKCEISGIPIKFYQAHKPKGYDNASLDRIDSSKGYIEGNVQWLHKRVNVMKNNMTNEELLHFCKAICNYYKNNEEK